MAEPLAEGMVGVGVRVKMVYGAEVWKIRILSLYFADSYWQSENPTPPLAIMVR